MLWLSGSSSTTTHSYHFYLQMFFMFWICFWHSRIFKRTKKNMKLFLANNMRNWILCCCFCCCCNVYVCLSVGIWVLSSVICKQFLKHVSNVDINKYPAAALPNHEAERIFEHRTNIQTSPNVHSICANTFNNSRYNFKCVWNVDQ